MPSKRRILFGNIVVIYTGSNIILFEVRQRGWNGEKTYIATDRNNIVRNIKKGEIK